MIAVDAEHRRDRGGPWEVRGDVRTPVSDYGPVSTRVQRQFAVLEIGALDPSGGTK